jgi:acetoin utilization protein AcuB
MRVAEIMSPNPKSIRATDTIADAIVLLADYHVTGVPVVEDHGRLVGVLSNSDILEAIAEHADRGERDQLLEETTVNEIMTPRPQTIAPDALVGDAARRMLYLEVHRLFVEDEGRLVGVVSTTDLVRVMAGQKV